MKNITPQQIIVIVGIVAGAIIALVQVLAGLPA